MASVTGDPRRPAEVHSFIREPIDASTASVDYYSLLSLVLGSASFVLKWKSLAWCCFIFCFASFINMRSLESDVKSLSMSIMLASMSLVSAYTGDQQHAITIPIPAGGAALDSPAP